MTIPPILLVGFGKMGGAMLTGWREKGLEPSIAVDPACPATPGPNVTVLPDASHIPDGFSPSAVSDPGTLASQDGQIVVDGQCAVPDTHANLPAPQGGGMSDGGSGMGSGGNGHK